MQLKKLIINLLLVASLACLCVGLYLPLVTVSKLYIFRNEVSMFTGLAGLWREEQYLVFIVLLAFSVLLPLSKTGLLLLANNFQAWSGSNVYGVMRWLSHHGKWSMLDVFVVAVLVVSLKLGALASVSINVGFYVFSTSVILTMLITGPVTRVLERYVQH
jgi:paraquat-inducible protein A